MKAWRYVALLALAACHHGPNTEEGYVLVPSVGLELLAPDGWRVDPSVHAPDRKGGGLALRLIRTQAVAGSPRIEVVMEPATEHSASLEEFLAQNLTEMSRLNEAGSLRITKVEQSAIMVGPRRSFRVRHEYLLGTGDVSITQVTTLLILDGRGVAITAVGRTELYTPLSASVDQILAAVRTTAEPTGDGATSPLLRPIDLNKDGK